MDLFSQRVKREKKNGRLIKEPASEDLSKHNSLRKRAWIEDCLVTRYYLLKPMMIVRERETFSFIFIHNETRMRGMLTLGHRLKI